MKNYFAKCVLMAGLLAVTLTATAEDIDLFVNPPSATTGQPNLLFLFDNAAGFSSSATHGCKYADNNAAPSLGNTTGGMEQCALYNSIYGLETEVDGKAKVNIGLMAFNANKFVDWQGNKCDLVNTNGGCLMVPLTSMTATNKAAVLAWIKTWGTTFTIKTNANAAGALMQEAWAYYTGRTGISGRSYASIKPAATCYKNYIAYVGNAYASNGSANDQTGASGPKDPLWGLSPVSNKNAFPAATAAQKSPYLGTVTTMCGTFTFPSTSHENGGYYADEWARYMAGAGIVSYTIGVHSASCKADYAALLSSMASLSGGKYFPTTDFTALKAAVESILSEVQSINSVFASVSLPVSVNTQGTYLNQVFVGMFRPDKNVLPRWHGNLKQYKIGKVGGALQLLDADDTSAISGNGSGFIAECARSFWTPLKSATDSYWTPYETASCSGYAASSNTPDGNVVEKGAQGFKLRSLTPSARKLYTCSPDFASCTARTDFVTTNTAITATLLGAADSTEKNALINWARGLNNNGDETFVAAANMRPSSHADVVHSRPVALNYGTATVPSVVVFYGGNDGILRAINGNRTADLGSATAGSELWAFIAPEFYPSIKRNRDNTTKISYKGSAIAGALPKSYGFDGPVTAYKDATKTWIYAAMRRGGRAVYAFDVTDPADPKLKWKVGCPNQGNDTGCTSGFEQIGQTWSSPHTLKSSGYGLGASPMVIMGGGYNSCEDADANTCTSTSKGNRIYLLDAISGASLKTFNTDRGVMGDVTIVRDYATQMAKYIYAADLGGNVYRISGADGSSPIGTTAPSSWTMTKIASLGGTGISARKFMFAPDVVEENGVNYVLLGSGDREKPLTAYSSAIAVENHFFMIKDKPDNATWLSSESGNCGGTSVICKASLTAITSTSTPTQTTLDASKGWYLGLSSTEQVVTSAITFYGAVTFSTHMPAAAPQEGVCASNLGEARVYNIKYLNAESIGGADNSRYADLAGDGLPPSPVAGMVTLDSGETVPFVIGANAKSPLEVAPPPPAPPGSAGTRPKSRVYWYIQQ